MLEIKNCSASYDNCNVFTGLDFTLGKKESASIIGPSGCGKSTFLKIASGLKKADSGTVTLDSSEISTPENRIAVILQNYGLFPWMNVMENCSLPLKIKKTGKTEIEEITEPIMKRLGILHLRKKYPSEISGGEMQRVAIARTMTLSPDFLLMDEPFSALDAITRELIQDLLLEILSERETGSLIVTHSIEEAVFLSSSIYIMPPSPHEGFKRKIENPFGSGGHSRKSEIFFKCCLEVREIMEKYSGNS